MATGGDKGYDEVDFGDIGDVHHSPDTNPSFPGKTAEHRVRQGTDTQEFPGSVIEHWFIKCPWIFCYGATCQKTLDIFVDVNRMPGNALAELTQATGLPEDKISIFRQISYAILSDTSFLGGSVQCNGQNIVIGGLLTPAPPSDLIFAFTVSHNLQQGAQVSWVGNTEARSFGTVEFSVKEDPATSENQPLGMNIDFALIKVDAQCLQMCRHSIQNRQPVNLYQHGQLDEAVPDEYVQVKKWGPASNQTNGYLRYSSFMIKQEGNRIVRAMAVKDKDVAFHTQGDSGSLVRCRRCHVGVGLLFKRAKMPLEERVMTLSLVSPLTQGLARAATLPQCRFLSLNSYKVYYVGP